MKKFTWPGTALVCCVLLTSATAHAQPSKASPFDGMSAIDIEVAAALQNTAANASIQSKSVDGPQTGGSPVDFLRFDFVEVKGRLGHQGEFRIPGEPRPGPGTGLAHMSGRVEAVQFRLETENGDLIGYIDLQPPKEPAPALDFLGEIPVPDQPFRVAAAGTDVDDLAFDVVWDHLFTPQSLEVRFDPEILVVGSGDAELDATVTNHGPTGTFAISVATNLGLDVSSNLLELELTEGASAPIVVTVTVPAISSGVLDILVTAAATSIADEEITNHGTSLVRTEQFEKVFWDGFD